ncbi:MAG: hypothetical protein C0591_08115, partial [Marinilabiliales bacterium]
MGIVSEEWNDPLNWDINEIPGTYSDITIPASPEGSYFPVINSESSIDCNNLTIEQGSLLQLKGFLTVLGELNNADESSLVILSDASGTGSLIFNSENISGSIQRYLSDGENHFIGASTNGAIVNDLYFNNNPAVYMYSYSEISGDWVSITDLNTPLDLGIGYSVFVSDSENKQNVTATFSGTINMNDLTIPSSALSYSEESPYPGYNLISNPFTSSMSWDLGNWQGENISGSVWLWNGSYNYLFRNAQGMGNLANGIIPVSQAFFVRTISNNATLTLSADDRVHSNQNFYKTSERENEAYIALKVQNQNKTDEVWVTFCDGCTEGEDIGWDTEKLYGNSNAPQLFIRNNAREISIEALPPLGYNTRTLQLDFIAGVNGAHSIALAEIEHGPIIGEIEVFIIDKIEESEQILSLENPIYYFEASTDDPSDRFELKIWEGPNGINDADYQNDYLIYANKNTVRIKPLQASSYKNITVQIFDLSGRIIKEVRNASGNEMTIPLDK